MIEEGVLELLVLLAAYRRHESPNAFLRIISESSAEAPHLQALAQVSRRVLERCMYPAETTATATVQDPAPELTKSSHASPADLKGTNPSATHDLQQLHRWARVSNGP